MAILTALMASGAGELRGKVAGGGELAERVARVFSPEMRRTEARLGQLAAQLASLPELRATAFASRYGFRSETLVEQERPQWVQIDMERSYPIDCVVAVPTHIPAIRNRGEGYGFPLRFRIEVANDPGMADAVQEPSVYVKALLNAVVPLALVTDIEPTPADPGGVTKVKDESLTTVKLVAAVPPTVTPVVPVKLPPDTVMVVPPVVDPLTGEMESSRGATVNDRAYRSKLGEPEPGLPTVLAVATFFNAVSTCAGVAVLLRLR